MRRMIRIGRPVEGVENEVFWGRVEIFGAASDAAFGDLKPDLEDDRDDNGGDSDDDRYGVFVV